MISRRRNADINEQLSGRVDTLEFHSKILRTNHLGDPPQRPLWIYLPPGYDQADRRYPSIYVLQGYGLRLSAWNEHTRGKPTFIESIDRSFSQHGATRAIVVFVDGWTRYGGSQFIDSRGTGRYHSYLADEIVPFVDGRYRTLPASMHRGIAGHSSGGFGALASSALRPDLFGALATHAGDALYEYLYLPEFARATRNLRPYSGDIWQWWRKYLHKRGPRSPEDENLLMTLGCAACFSPSSTGAPTLPFDPATGVLDERAWRRWLAWDPIRMVKRYAEALRGTHGVWIGAGASDEYFLDLGSTALHETLLGIGVPERSLHFELFEGLHDGNEHRYPVALKWLCERLKS